MLELLKLIIDLIESFTPNFNNNIVECSPENIDNLSHEKKVKLVKRISQDLDGCRKAHHKIELGESKKLTPFIKLGEYTDDRNRKSTAVQVRGPFGLGADISGCFTERDRSKKESYVDKIKDLLKKGN